MEKRAPVHTVVIHFFPDIEVLLMLFLVTVSSAIRAKLGIVDGFKIKVIYAGSLRAEDFPGLPLDPVVLERDYGFLGLDCMGGRFDQHALPEEFGLNTSSSIELMVSEIGLDLIPTCLHKIIGLVATHDRTGEAIVSGPYDADSPTPHTQRHLNNLIIGWNRLFSALVVARLSHTAFGSLMHEVNTHQAQLLEDDPSGALLANDQTDYRQFFWFDRILAAAPSYFEADQCVDVVEWAVLTFQDRSEKAFARLEREWNDGERDYWDPTKTQLKRLALIVTAPDGTKSNGARVLCIGRSTSSRYSAVARHGNRNPTAEREERWSADIVIQSNPLDPGRFSITTKGIKLNNIAAALREADLVKKGVEITEELRARLSQPGNIQARDREGRPHEAIYFPVFETALGTAFRTNPDLEPTALSHDEIVTIVVRTLAQHGV